MKVLLAGDLHGPDLGANFHMIMPKLAHGFARAGYGVQAFNDRQAARYATPLHSRKLGRRRANAQLLTLCRNFQPDLLLLGHCETIANDTLVAAREPVPGLRIAYLNVDPLPDCAHDNYQRIAQRTDVVDRIFVTTAGDKLRQFAGNRARVHFMPNPIDPSIETLRQFDAPAERLPVDLFFGFMGRAKPGDAQGEQDPRVAIASELKRRLPDAALDLRGLDQSPVRGQRYFDAIARARMGLNFSRFSDHYLYSSDRMSHYVGSGLLTLIDRATGFGELFGEDELAFYGDRDELVAKIEHYRQNDGARRAVAEAGWRRGHQLFEVTRIARYIAETVFETGASERYEWPTEAARPL